MRPSMKEERSAKKYLERSTRTHSYASSAAATDPWARADGVDEADNGQMASTISMSGSNLR
jgi:hypothetical protein